ncbi:MAG: FMN-binding protein, partial [Gemmobacter sp.]|nr:FMN-binding protein [Gemmobacter sp.]
MMILAALLKALSIVAVMLVSGLTTATAQTFLSKLLPDVQVGDLVEGADAFGSTLDTLPVVQVMKAGERIGYAFITSDFVATTGYSGKPIHTMVAVNDAAQVIGVQLVKHSEPIVLIGIPDAKVKALVAGYRGLDLVAEAAAGGSSRELDIISGATVTIMVIDDSIIRAGLRVVRQLGLGGLAVEEKALGPQFELNLEAEAATDWMTLEGDGTLRRLSIDVEQVNAAFAAMDDPRAAARALTDPPNTPFLELEAALVSHPAIAKAILGDAAAKNLKGWLADG